jgi:hypothetical protein
MQESNTRGLGGRRHSSTWAQETAGSFLEALSAGARMQRAYVGLKVEC